MNKALSIEQHFRMLELFKMVINTYFESIFELFPAEPISPVDRQVLDFMVEIGGMEKLEINGEIFYKFKE